MVALTTMLLLAGAVAGLPGRPALAAGPEGQVTWAVHVSLAPTWFDPAETAGIITPFMVLYALHDALVKPMPGKAMAPSLAVARLFAARQAANYYRRSTGHLPPKLGDARA